MKSSTFYDLKTSTAKQFAPRPDWRSKTKFERRGEVAGHGVWDVIYKRV